MNKTIIIMMMLLMPIVNAGVLHPYTCDGTATGTLEEGDDLCVYGTGFEPETTIDVYVVPDNDVGSIDTVEKQEITITQKGILVLTKLWSNVKQGFYDLVADVNRNSEIDNGDVVNIAGAPGVTVNGQRSNPDAEVPEFSTMTAFLALIGANYYIFKKRRLA